MVPPISNRIIYWLLEYKRRRPGVIILRVFSTMLWIWLFSSLEWFRLCFWSPTSCDYHCGRRVQQGFESGSIYIVSLVLSWMFKVLVSCQVEPENWPDSMEWFGVLRFGMGLDWIRKIKARKILDLNRLSFRPKISRFSG